MASDYRDQIVGFLREIGLTVVERALPEGTFLPGVTLENGTLVFDPARGEPGDMLHEAGHLAVVLPEERATMSADAGPDAGLEMAAIAWSYAAAVHLGIPIETLFHSEGYKGQSEWLMREFQNGGSIGVPILEWRGLTDFQQVPKEHSDAYYPKMRKWLAESPHR